MRWGTGVVACLALANQAEGWCNTHDEGDCYLMIRAGRKATGETARGIRFFHVNQESEKEEAFAHIAGIPNGKSELSELQFALGDQVHATLSATGLFQTKRMSVGSSSPDTSSPFALQVTDGGIQIRKTTANAKLSFQSGEGESSNLEHSENVFTVSSSGKVKITSAAGTVEIQGALFQGTESLPAVSVGSLSASESIRILGDGALALENGSGDSWKLENGGSRLGFGLVNGDRRVVRVAEGAPKDSLTVSPEGFIGVGTPWPSVRLDVNGGVQGTSAYSSASDARYKTNVEPLVKNLLAGEFLDIVDKLHPVRFDWDQAKHPDKRFEEGRQLGFIAQELEKLVPEVVLTDKRGMKAVKYAALTPVLAAALQELRVFVSTREHHLTERISALEKELIQLKLSLTT